MKIHLIKKQSIIDYTIKNARSKPSFRIWLTALKYSNWNQPKDIQDTFGSADFLGGTERVVFDIGGNNYRLICSYHFGNKEAHLYVKWIGTHAEYDRLCMQNKQYTVSNY